jgi:CRP/FNR family transcriptional regulator, polysaccharide utilization system transcription regulator
MTNIMCRGKTSGELCDSIGNIMSHSKVIRNLCSECNVCNVRSDSVFSVLPEAEIEELQRVKKYITFASGELIFKERQQPNGIYIITDGKVKISKCGYEGREHIVRFATAGSILGYRSLLGGECYTCSASAISETHLCFIPGEIIFKLIRQNPELGIQFIKKLADDLKNAENASIRLAQKPVRERIAAAILTLKDVYGFEPDKETLNISLRRDEIAGIAGTSRETATRLLQEYCAEKIISLSGRKIKITNIGKLIKDANISF